MQPQPPTAKPRRALTLWVIGGAFLVVVVVLVAVLAANGNKDKSRKTNTYNLGHAFGLTLRNFPQGQSQASQLCQTQGMNLASYQGPSFDESAFVHGCLAGAGITGS